MDGKPWNGEERQAKRRRKVKTGCRTCKMRKVKCDEGRPACQRCISTGRICNGYGIWGGGGNDYHQRIRPASHQKTAVPHCAAQIAQKQDNLLICLRKFPKQSLTEGERSSYEFFAQRTAKKLPGVFGPSFWETLVIQASVHEPVIFRAVLALGSAHKAKVLDSASKNRESNPPAEHEMFMLRQYGMAINLLNENIQAAEGSLRDLIRRALVACLIFISLEYLRGRYSTGKMHLDNGLKLLQLLKGDEYFTNEMDLCVVELFERLRVQVELLGQCSRLQMPRFFAPSTPHNLNFRSPTEGKYLLDRLMDDIMGMTERIQQIPTSETKSRRLLKTDHVLLRSALGVLVFIS